MNIDSANLSALAADPSPVEGPVQAAAPGEAGNAFGNVFGEALAAQRNLPAPGLTDAADQPGSAPAEGLSRPQPTSATGPAPAKDAGAAAPADRSEELLDTFAAMRRFTGAAATSPEHERPSADCDSAKTGEAESPVPDAGFAPVQGVSPDESQSRSGSNVQISNNEVILTRYAVSLPAGDVPGPFKDGDAAALLQTAAEGEPGAAENTMTDRDPSADAGRQADLSPAGDQNAALAAVWSVSSPPATGQPVTGQPAIEQSAPVFGAPQPSDDQGNQIFAQIEERPSPDGSFDSNPDLRIDKTAGFDKVSIIQANPAANDAGPPAGAMPGPAQTAAVPAGFGTASAKAGFEAGTGMLPLTREIHQPGWDADLGERVIWMHGRSVSAAEITLNPRHLGPVSVRIDVSQDQAAVAFAAHNGAVREALEASIPKLREMMGAQQLDLVNVSVSQQFPSNQDGSRRHAFDYAPAAAGAFGAAAETDAGEEKTVTAARGLLNLYA